MTKIKNIKDLNLQAKLRNNFMMGVMHFLLMGELKEQKLNQTTEIQNTNLSPK